MSDDSRGRMFADALQQLEDGDADALLGCFRDGAELLRPEQRHIGAQEDASTFWQQYRAQFEQVHTEFDRIVDAGDESILEWHSSGTLSSGRPIQYAGVSLLTFEGDKVARFATYYDTAAFTNPSA